MILFAVVRDFNETFITDDTSAAVAHMWQGMNECVAELKYGTFTFYIVDRFPNLKTAAEWVASNRGGIGHNDGDTLLSIYSVIEGRCCKQHGVSVL